MLLGNSFQRRCASLIQLIETFSTTLYFHGKWGHNERTQIRVSAIGKLWKLLWIESLVSDKSLEVSILISSCCHRCKEEINNNYKENEMENSEPTTSARIIKNTAIGIDGTP